MKCLTGKNSSQKQIFHKSKHTLFSFQLFGTNEKATKLAFALLYGICEFMLMLQSE
jgi:hypothetical protein